MTRRLIIDVDNCLWDAYPWTIEAANRIFHTNISIEDVGHWYGWEPLLGKNWFDAFTEALDPERVVDRPPLPGSVLAIYGLSEVFRLHFVSHNPKPKALYEPLRAWIEREFTFDGDDFDLKIFGARNCKVDYMGELGDVWGIVEDKPDTLRKSVKKGYNTFGRVTPLNKREVIPGVKWFWDWSYGEQIILDHEEAWRWLDNGVNF